MKILSATGGLADTNGYLILDEEHRLAIIIDVPQDTMAPLLKAVQAANARVQYLLLTHGHWDHIGDHRVVTDAFPDAKVLISAAEEPRLQKPSAMSFDLPYAIPPRSADAYIQEGQTISAGTIQLVALHTPGHAAGHMCFHWPQRRILFAGDLLMAGTVGRWDFADGDVEQLQASLRRVLALPQDTAVLSGHGPPTTLSNECQSNPFILNYRLAPGAVSSTS